jgi:hypothetical protein
MSSRTSRHYEASVGGLPRQEPFAMLGFGMAEELFCCGIAVNIYHSNRRGCRQKYQQQMRAFTT